MAWDFSTEPEFEEQLEWMRAFVREEVWPIEAIEHEIGQPELDRIGAPLQERVKERGLWAAHLPPELGGQGFGQVKLGLMNEILGTSIYAPPVFGCQAPDSGNSEIIALAGTDEQKERWLFPLLNGEIRSAFSMTEPDTPGSDPTQLADPRSPRRRRLRPRRAQVVHLERLDRRRPRRDGGHRSRRRAARAGLDVPRPRRHARCQPGARRRQHGAAVRALRHARRPHRDPLREREARPRCAAREGGRRVPDRPAPPRSRSDPPLHALARGGAARLRHDVRALALPPRQGRTAEGQADGAGLDRRLGGRDAGGAADDAARRLEDGPCSARAPPGRTSR